ncbi:hypothetical protein DOTSEDRAFT_56465 [Dothistroma septosporum NZE10]|uniref:Arrestin-like N-terminal domain-containing protein n=1 Tax=Dothistroma septosporum (strain NZE10 / CBS 128990) TaxID=675120 RepID=N1PG12_DOTSN|nr:hypothetical protein DOTSEDRAFT_56465 [Dothistroma septosporum NZE10]
MLDFDFPSHPEPKMNHENHGPPPSISLQLTNGSRATYRPGSIVVGSLILRTATPRTIISATVQFTGKTTAHSKRRVQQGKNHHVTHHYSHEVLFFDPSQMLANNIPTQDSGITTWVFSFKFPSRAGGPLTPEPFPTKTTSRGFYESRSHPLPPTCIHRRSGHDDYFAIVSYNIVATIQLDDQRTAPIKTYLHPERFMAKDPHDELFEVSLRSIVFDQDPPSGPYDGKLVQAFMPSQMYSSSRLHGQEESKMGGLRGKFSKAPSVRVRTNYSFPSTLATSQTFSIHASVEIDQFSDSAIAIPAVALRITSLKLAQVTYYRATRSNHSRETEIEELDKSQLTLNAKPDGVVVNLGDAIDDGAGKLIFATSFQARLPADIPSSFRTFNINRSYQVKIAVETEVCGKTFEHDYETPFETVSVVAPAL